jgi:hypothetical protein
MLNEFYRVAFHIKIYSTCDELQADLDAWLNFTTSNDRIRSIVLWKNSDANVS